MNQDQLATHQLFVHDLYYPRFDVGPSEAAEAKEFFFFKRKQNPQTTSNSNPRTHSLPTNASPQRHELGLIQHVRDHRARVLLHHAGSAARRPAVRA